MDDYMQIANSVPLWLAAAVPVCILMLQSVLFVKKSIVAGKKMGITDEQIKKAAKSSAVASIGPSLAILAGMISLIVAMGGPISWMRLAFIGSVAYELMAASFGASAMGAVLGKEGMTAMAFANGVWAMTLGCVGWILFTAFATPKLDKFRNVLAGGKKALIPIVASAASLGAFGYLNADRVIKFKDGAFLFDNGTVASFAGFFIMASLVIYARKANAQWVKEWGLTIAMFGGMIIAALV